MGVSMTSPSRGRVELTCALTCALFAAACSVDTRPFSNGLVVSVESDLSAPKDLDRIIVDVAQGSRSLLHEEHAIGTSALPLPAEFRVAYPGNSQPATVRVTAFKGSQPRIERSAITSIPSTRWAMLRLPLNFLCDGKVDSDGLSTCTDGKTCIDGTCGDPAVSESDLPKYEPARGKSDAGQLRPVSTSRTASRPPATLNSTTAVRSN